MERVGSATTEIRKIATLRLSSGWTKSGQPAFRVAPLHKPCGAVSYLEGLLHKSQTKLPSVTSQHGKYGYSIHRAYGFVGYG